MLDNFKQKLAAPAPTPYGKIIPQIERFREQRREDWV